MTVARFTYQRECVWSALADLDGLILNVGCNEDPANLKAIDPQRVVNCDIFAMDTVMDRPNRVDVLFDCARDTWPFSPDEAALVVLGDILEHLKPEEIEYALTEARRVGQRLCITVPCDTRETNNDDEANKYPRGAVHRTVVTEKLLCEALDVTGWKPREFVTVDYGFCPDGFFVTCDPAAAKVSVRR